MMSNYTEKTFFRYVCIAASILSIFLLMSTQSAEKSITVVQPKLRENEVASTKERIGNSMIDIQRIPTRTEDPIQKDMDLRDKEEEVKWEAFNSTNPHVNSWCPYAKCLNSPTCTPCNQRFLFIVGTGRAGSTSLLRLFNELPNVRLSGENYNEFRKASELSTNLFESKEDMFHYGKHQDGPFLHNAIPKGSFGCLMQDLHRFMNPPPLAIQERGLVDSYDSERILGMKTIRLHQDWSALKAATFFKENFPCSKFVVNIRSDLESQLASFESLNWSSVNEEKIKKANRFYKNFVKEMGEESATLIDMKKWKNDVEIINNAVKWLGYRDCEFDTTFHENSGGYGRDEGTTVKLGSKCRLE